MAMGDKTYTCPQVLHIGGEASRFLVITHKLYRSTISAAALCDHEYTDSSIFALAMNVSAMRFLVDTRISCKYAIVVLRRRTHVPMSCTEEAK